MLARMVAWPFRFGWRPRTPEARRHLYAIWSTTQEGEPAIRRIEADRERRLGLPLDNDNIKSLQQQFSSWDLSVNLGEIRCPVLLVYGSRDAMAVAGAEIFQASLRNIEVCRLEGVGHDPFFEAPNASITAVQAFMLGT